MNSTNALILCGGGSTRMGQPKFLLDYHGEAQAYHLYHLASTICSKVYLSINPSQDGFISSEYKTILDEPAYAGHGPMSGLLSAFQKHPKADWLLLACDYPFIAEKDIEKLVGAVGGDVVSYCHPSTKLPEPLVGIYRASSHPVLLLNFQAGKDSLYRILQQMNLVKVYPDSPKTLTDCDTIAEFRRLKRELGKQKI